MDPILRAIIIYFVLLIIFRVSGKRTLAEITPFDFILLLIIGGATEHGLLGDDFSVTNAFLLVITLICCDIGLSLIKERSSWFAKVTESTPVILLEHGRIIPDRAKRARIDEGDILEAGRKMQGIERLDQIKFAVLERDGGITIIPADSK